jgi:hypothetical protein
MALEKAIKDKERIGLGCISTLINKNFYDSAEYLFENYYKKRNLSQKAIYEFRNAMKNTTHHMDELVKLSKRQQTSYLERSPPTRWAQSLDQIEMEIKFSLRHGVPGCINIFDLNVTITRDTFNLTGFCYEGDIKMKYVLNLHLWGSIDPEESDWEMLSVGEISVTLVKDPKPGRWMTLTFDEKPENLELWFERHQKYAYRLDDFEEDDVWEYDGWDIENDEDDEDEDKIWNKPIVRKKQLDRKPEQVQDAVKPRPKKKSKKSKKKAETGSKKKKSKKGKKGKKKKAKK